MSESEWDGSVTEGEIDMLLLYYTFSDQYGRVDVLEAANYAARKLGVIIDRTPVSITQDHCDLLMDRQIIPDVRVIWNKICDPNYTPPESEA